MKEMKIARGTARASRRIHGGRANMAPPSATAQAAMLADRFKANRKLGVKLFFKAGAGV